MLEGYEIEETAGDASLRFVNDEEEVLVTEGTTSFQLKRFTEDGIEIEEVSKNVTQEELAERITT